MLDSERGRLTEAASRDVAAAVTRSSLRDLRRRRKGEDRVFAAAFGRQVRLGRACALKGRGGAKGLWPSGRRRGRGRLLRRSDS